MRNLLPHATCPSICLPLFRWAVLHNRSLCYGKGPAHDEAVVAKSTRPSVLDHLKRPMPPRSTDKKPKQHEEVR